MIIEQRAMPKWVAVRGGWQGDLRDAGSQGPTVDGRAQGSYTSRLGNRHRGHGRAGRLCPRAYGSRLYVMEARKAICLASWIKARL